MNIKIDGPHLSTAAICEPILRSLPEWFGIEEATQHYIQAIETLPTFLALEGDNALGFLSIKQHNQHAAEIYVMGITPEAHRQGIGRALVKAAKEYLRGLGVEYLQVKTLSPSREDRHYTRTRRFYLAMDFRPLEEFTNLWGKENPCLQMIIKL